MSYAPDDRPWCADCGTPIPKTGVPCRYDLFNDILICEPCGQRRDSGEGDRAATGWAAVCPRIKYDGEQACTCGECDRGE